MDIIITSKTDHITKKTKDYAFDKANKLEKYNNIRKIEVIMDQEGKNYFVEFLVSPERGDILVAKTQEEEWFSAIDLASDKIEKQLRRLKEKIKKHRGRKNKNVSELEINTNIDENKEEETYEEVVEKMKNS